MDEIADLPVREKIGRAKSAPADSFEADYTEIEAELDRELEAAIPKK